MRDVIRSARTRKNGRLSGLSPHYARARLLLPRRRGHVLGIPREVADFLRSPCLRSRRSPSVATGVDSRPFGGGSGQSFLVCCRDVASPQEAPGGPFSLCGTQRPRACAVTSSPRGLRQAILRSVLASRLGSLLRNAKMAAVFRPPEFDRYASLVSENRTKQIFCTVLSSQPAGLHNPAIRTLCREKTG